MTDFGGELRQARERRGVSLRQIAASTKISVAALEALEQNDISRLPGGVFSRAFVRSYAIEVGLDPDETVREFIERFHGEPHRPEAPASARPLPEEESDFESQQRMASVVLKLVLISVPAAALILYLAMRPRNAPQASVEEQEAAETARADDVPHAAADRALSPPSVAAPQSALAIPQAPTQPASAVPAVQVPAATSPAASTEPLTLELHPTGPCWVVLTIDGRRVFGRVLQPGEKAIHRIRESAVVEIGDAGAFAFSINGRPGRSLGDPGQVTTARITKETAAQYLR